MNLKLLSAFCWVIFEYAVVLADFPKTNPVSTHYNDVNYPNWTDRIQWNNVYNMATYANGNNDFEKFENARDEAYSNGGGILYYPAGIYNFSDAPADGANGRGLMLKTGVILRGETPTGDSDAYNGSLALPTKFVFKLNDRAGGKVPRDWNIIGLMPSGTEQLKDVHNVGIAWVHLSGATVFFGPQAKFGPTWATAGSWLSRMSKAGWKNRKADGTHPIDFFAASLPPSNSIAAGSGRLVFGCQLDHAVVINDALDYTLSDSVGKSAANKSGSENPNFFHVYKFGARIGVYGSHIFIANNAITKSNQNFTYVQKTCNTIQGLSGSGGCQKICSSNPNSTLIFDYAKQTGIDVNKELYGLNGGNFFDEDVVVKNNYVYNHGLKGYNISGNHVIIQHNYNDRDFQQEGDDVYGLGTGWELTLDGYMSSTAGGNGCISDNLSRAFDLGGSNVWIDSNVYFNTGSNPGNDGEGILCQAHGGTQWYSWALTRNTRLAGKGGGYMGGYDISQYGSLIAWNTSSSWVGNIANGANIDAAFVNNNASVKTTGSDVIITCPSGSVNAPIHVSATPKPDSNFVWIKWEDNATNEIGFRIDISVNDSEWQTIVYRPRKSTGTSYNKQEWKDYLAPRGKALRYRVVAINCDEDTTNASVVLPIIHLRTITSLSLEIEKLDQSISIYPNPTSNHITLDFSKATLMPQTIGLYSIQGHELIKKNISTVHFNSDTSLIELETHAFANGFYLLAIETDKGIIYKKVNIQH